MLTMPLLFQTKMHTLTNEIDGAIVRHERLKQEKEAEKQRKIASKPKQKGYLFKVI